MSDPRAESLPESELRVVLKAGGFDPTPQHRILKNGIEVARLDLAILETKTAIEYDGYWHRERRQTLLDQARRGRLAAEGWQFIVVTAEDLAGDPNKILEEVRRTQHAA